jgi:hypothetical protein
MAKSEKQINLGSLPINGRKSPVYLLPQSQCLQITSRGRAKPLYSFLGEIPKGDARRVRKALRAAGFATLAASPSDPR